MNKAICEMSLEELKTEYYMCVRASNDESLDFEIRKQAHIRADIVWQAIKDFKCIV